ncbi:dihydrofolate reductase family protein [Nesterenkonia xinjiangensis]|uniref:Dihydrofolate reductase n=1 Tax=Nesterenkonia xinjiangensis TaxID=225327 RepID=A0A7Z0KC66_9MICC|nr:dihydrofolate reductase family protein [Nesterenkonia xinjiangensis]NYJ78337.1 dihydrofolate reductase [Nesterenkonia xinjiangensis]
MGRLIVDLIVSADGCAQDADGGMDHVPPTVDAGGCDVDTVTRWTDVDAIILGANTYRLFAGHWPKVTPEQDLLAGIINSRPKHVVSTRLEEAPWGSLAPARIESGDGVASVRRIKERSSGEVVVWGSLSLVSNLFEAGEVDGLRLRIVPTLAGGRRSFTPHGLGVRDLELVHSRSYSAGQQILEYRLSDPT